MAPASVGSLLLGYGLAASWLILVIGVWWWAKRRRRAPIEMDLRDFLLHIEEFTARLGAVEAEQERLKWYVLKYGARQYAESLARLEHEIENIKAKVG